MFSTLQNVYGQIKLSSLKSVLAVNLTYYQLIKHKKMIPSISLDSMYFSVMILRVNWRILSNLKNLSSITFHYEDALEVPLLSNNIQAILATKSLTNLFLSTVSPSTTFILAVICTPWLISTSSCTTSVCFSRICPWEHTCWKRFKIKKK